MSETILVTDQGPWVEITLNRPDRLNSFNDDMHRAFRAALQAAQGKRAVLITGAGRGFCARAGSGRPGSGQNAGQTGPVQNAV